MTDKKFIIGIGSQRAGSTLLHKILDECTEIFMHPVKELHYYDTFFDIRHSNVLKDFSKRQLNHILDRIIKSQKHDFIDKKYKCNIRTNKILSNQQIKDIEYIDLYRPCVSENKYLGEITPEYMILPEEGISKMRDDLGEDTKIILISRDPVERFISAFKLLKMYNNKDYDSSKFQEDLEETMNTMTGWMEQQDQLNDYETALTRYKKYFKNVLFISYEQMVSDKEGFFEELQTFLGIDIDKEKFDKVLGKKVNAIGETGKVSENLLETFKKRYEKEIEYLKNNFKKEKSNE